MSKVDSDWPTPSSDFFKTNKIAPPTNMCKHNITKLFLPIYIKLLSAGRSENKKIKPKIENKELAINK